MEREQGNKTSVESVSIDKHHTLIHISSHQIALPLHLYFFSFLHCAQYRGLAPMYYRGAAAAIVVYDITRAVSVCLCDFVLI